ncbi:diguanylate cyclase domain-containing protein [Orrella sp. 11846]|uniref:diguanylate cyclase domain-containing protein n=1 Tax=Orrella sp. 11846 TaxID=3409913 RepID=UPI003B5AE281
MSRLGGDEYALLLTDLPQDLEQAACQTESKSQEILNALKAPFDLGSGLYEGQASLGAVVFTDDQVSAQTLLEQVEQTACATSFIHVRVKQASWFLTY